MRQSVLQDYGMQKVQTVAFTMSYSAPNSQLEKDLSLS